MRSALRSGIAFVALALAACGGGNTRPMVTLDAGGGGGGGTDAGTTTPRDAGTTGPRDAGGGGGGGGCAGTISSTAFTPLTAGCFPRCSAATAAALMACPDPDPMGMCLNTSLDGDTTPTIPFTLNGMPAMGPMDCSTCFGYQQLSCAFDSCPTQTFRYLSCNPMMMDCASAVMALDACIMTNAMAFQTCAGARINQCFGTGGGAGFLPEAEAQPVRTLPWSAINDVTRAEFARDLAL